MSRTDEEMDRDWELDRNWKPSGRRPQSTIARSFSQELQDIFRIENSVADLDEKVDKRKQHITSQASELEAIEARIREMEERLRRSRDANVAGLYRASAPPPPHAHIAAAASAAPAPLAYRHRAHTASQLPEHADEDAAATRPAPYPKDEQQQQQAMAAGYHRHHRHHVVNVPAPLVPDKARSRPGTARQDSRTAPGSGDMPPTPVGSEGEYELVNREELDDDDDDDDEEDEEEEDDQRNRRRPSPLASRRRVVRG